MANNHFVLDDKIYKITDKRQNPDDQFLDTNTSIRGIIRGKSDPNTLVKFKFVKFKDPTTNTYKYLTQEQIEQNQFLLPTKKSRYLCLSDECTKCPFNSMCEQHIHTESEKNQIIVIDISAQEPMLSSLVHKEPVWITTQRNKNIRKEGLDIYLNEIAKELWGVTMDAHNISLEDFNYYHFLQHIEGNEFLLQSLLLFNDLGDEGKITQEMIDWWNIQFNQFKSSHNIC